MTKGWFEPIAGVTGVQSPPEVTVAALRDALAAVKPPSPQTVAALGQMFGLPVPPTIREWLAVAGGGVAGRLTVLGAGELSVGDETADVSLAKTMLACRLSGTFPPDLFPFVVHPDGAIAGLRISGGHEEAVAIMRGHDGVWCENDPELPALALARAAAACRMEVKRLANVERQMATLRDCVARLDARYHYGHAHRASSKLPKDYEWRAYRQLVADVVFAFVVCKHDRPANTVAVDVFLPAQVPGYDEHAGTRAATLLLLAEAYRLGTQMRVTFTANVNDGRLPEELVALAANVGVVLDAKEPEIDSDRGASLFCALGELPRHTLSRLPPEGRLRATYLTLAGSVTAVEVEHATALATDPLRLLNGGAPPHEAFSHLADLHAFAMAHASARLVRAATRSANRVTDLRNVAETGEELRVREIEARSGRRRRPPRERERLAALRQGVVLDDAGTMTAAVAVDMDALSPEDVELGVVPTAVGRLLRLTFDEPVELPLPGQLAGPVGMAQELMLVPRLDAAVADRLAISLVDDITQIALLSEAEGTVGVLAIPYGAADIEAAMARAEATGVCLVRLDLATSALLAAARERLRDCGRVRR